MSPTARSTTTAVAATVIAGSSLFGAGVLSLAVLLCVAAVTYGWSTLASVQHQRTAWATLGVAGAMSLLTVLLGHEEPYLRWMVVALAGGIIAAFVAEVLWPSDEGNVIASVSGNLSGIVAVAAGAAWIAAQRTPGSRDLVVAGAVAVALSAVASTISRNAVFNIGLSLTLGVAAGASSGYVFDTISWYGGALVGGMCAASVIGVAQMIRRPPFTATTFWAGISGGVLPVTVAGALVYLGGRILVG